MTHAPSGRRGHAGDKSCDRFLTICFDPFRRLFFSRASDFADQDHRFRFSIFVEKLHRIEVRHSVNRIAADADAGRLAVTARGQLPNRFVGERARARNHADVSRFVDVAGHNADLARAGRNDSGAIRSDQARLLSGHLRFHPHHVHDGNSFRDAHDEFNSCIGRFQNRIGRASCRHENHRDVAARFTPRFIDGVEYRHFVVELLAAFPRRNTSDDIRAVLHALPRVKSAGAAGDSPAPPSVYFCRLRQTSEELQIADCGLRKRFLGFLVSRFIWFSVCAPSICFRPDREIAPSNKPVTQFCPCRTRRHVL